MSRFLIRGGCVLSLHSKTGNHYQADLLIDGDRIAEVGQNLRARDAQVVDGTDTIVMPGFVDTHRHAWESLFRGLGNPDDASVSPSAIASHYSADDVYAATLIGLLGAAEAGITTVVDWCRLPVGEQTEAALQAHADAGLRTVFVGAADEDWQVGLRRLGGAGPLTTLAAGPADPSRDLDRVASDWALARELDLRIHSHVGTERTEQGIAAVLAARNLLGDDVTLVHCSNLDDADLDAISSSGSSVVLTPASEMTGGRQPLEIQKLVDRGIRPGLGVDSEQVAPGDMFAQMRAAIALQHATLFDLKLAGKAGLPRLLSTREVIRYASVDGARAIGLGTVSGALEPGRQADIVVLRTDRPNIWPINDPIGAVVWGMDTSNIDWVFVAGRPLMSNGVLDVDLERARSLATTARRRVASAVGMLSGTGAAE